MLPPHLGQSKIRCFPGFLQQAVHIKHHDTMALEELETEERRLAETKEAWSHFCPKQQEISELNGGFNGKINHKWGIFHVWTLLLFNDSLQNSASYIYIYIIMYIYIYSLISLMCIYVYTYN